MICNYPTHGRAEHLAGEIREEFIGLRQGQPRTITFGPPASDLAASRRRAVQAQAAIEMTHVPYRGAGPAMND